jgi:hypothetical protein
MRVQTASGRLENVRAQLEGPWRDEEERTVDTGALPITVRKRGRRYDLHDRGEAVASTASLDWLPIAEAVARREGFNVNRRGVVFVGAVEGRDLAPLIVRLADCAESVRAAILERE